MSDVNPLTLILEPVCSMGHTKVYTSDLLEESMKMARLCPTTMTTETTNSDDEEEQKCSCLPTVVVEQAIEDGFNPLGKKHKKCVYVDYNLVFPTADGLSLLVRFI